MKFSVFQLLKGIIPFVFFLSFQYQLSAQTSMGDWVKPSLQYYKLKIAKDGVYRLTYNDLIQKRIISSSAVDPRLFKLYRRGKEMAIYFKSENVNKLVEGDYLEFYAIKNDAGDELGLYEEFTETDFLTKSLYTDTAAYFLTYDATGVFGKRVKENAAPSVLNSQSVVLNKHYEFNGFYTRGKVYDSQYIFSSKVDQGEGWVSERIFGSSGGTEFTFDIAQKDVVSDSVQIDVVLFGGNNNAHEVAINIGTKSFTVPFFIGGSSRFFSFKISKNELGITNTVLKIVPRSGSENPDIVTLYTVDFKYESNFIPLKDNVSLGSNSSKTLVFESIDPIQVYDIQDFYNASKVNVAVQNTKQFVAIKSNEKFVFSDVALKPIVQKVNFPNISFDVDFLIIYHNAFVQGAEEYKLYRESLAGGSKRVASYDIYDLYNSWSFGDKNPMAIKRLLAHYVQNNSPLKDVILIGNGGLTDARGSIDGVAYYERDLPFDTLVNGLPVVRNKDYIPGFSGFPGSDLLYTMDLKISNEMAYNIGRLPVLENQEVLNYLEKVKEYEAQGTDIAWRKNLIHISGGKGSIEAGQFLRMVQDYEFIAKKGSIGATVKTYTKTSDQSVDTLNISDDINNGVGLVTYIGHSQANLIEVDIGKVSDDVNNYRNKGKYPFLLINGCHSGDTYASSYTLMDNWLLTADRGSIGSLGLSGYGYANDFDNFTEHFYNIAFKDTLFQTSSLGDIHREILRENKNSGSRFRKHFLSQFTYFGDPSIKLFPLQFPDYSITEDGITVASVDGNKLSATSDSFVVSLNIINEGKYIDGDSIDLCITRITSEDQKIYTPIKIPAIAYAGVVKLTLSNDGFKGKGNNTFVVTVNCNDNVKELNLNNNSASANFYFQSSGVKALLPSKYSIVPVSVLNIVGQIEDVSDNQYHDFSFSLDTTPLFNSPVLQKITINAKGVGVWSSVVLPVLKDTTVYFWKVILTDIDDLPVDQSSFMYIKDVSGWGQGHIAQFAENKLDGLKLNLRNDAFTFDSLFTLIEINTAASKVADYTYKTNLRIGGQTYIVETTSDIGKHYDCLENGVYVLPISGKDFLPFLPNFDLQSDRCGVVLGERWAEDFDMIQSNQQKHLMAYLDSLNKNDVFVFSSIGNAVYENWSTDLKDQLKGLGARFIDSLKNGRPYILIAKIGGGVIFENFGLDDGSQISGIVPVKGLASKGKITTNNINLKEPELFSIDFRQSANDKNVLNIWNNNQEHKVSIVQDTSFIISSLVGNVINNLQFSFENTDQVDQTFGGIRNWILTGELLPEAVAGLNSSAFFNIKDVDEGDSIQVNMDFMNLTNIDFKDSIVYHFSIRNENGSLIKDTLVTKMLLKNDTIFDSYFIDTRGLAGRNLLTVYYNPEIQLEQNYSNNVLSTSFQVIEDKRKPIMDVVFDGVHIMNRDIVSPEPLIGITIKDENQFLFIEDKDALKISLKSPCTDQVATCDFVELDVTDWITDFQKATKDKDFYLEFKPNRLPDGLYTLKIEGKDAKGNVSGNRAYEVTFEVINASTITHFYPYPNPFSTSMRFVFTLTGLELPDDMKIQIMTVSGRVVREIMMDELGPIKIGNNVTQFSWNGTDEYGDRLANGAYFYKVFMKGADQFEHRDSAIDKGITKGYGKIYILR